MKDLENGGKIAPLADRADILGAVARYCAPFLRGINEDTPAFCRSFIYGNTSRTWKRALSSL